MLTLPHHTKSQMMPNGSTHVERLKSISISLLPFFLSLALYLPFLEHLVYEESMHPAIPGVCFAAGVWLLWVAIVLAAAVNSPAPPDMPPHTDCMIQQSPSLHDNIKYEIYLCLSIEEALELRGVCRLFYCSTSPAVRWDAANRDDESNKQRVCSLGYQAKKLAK